VFCVVCVKKDKTEKKCFVLRVFDCCFPSEHMRMLLRASGKVPCEELLKSKNKERGARRCRNFEQQEQGET